MRKILIRLALVLAMAGALAVLPADLTGTKVAAVDICTDECDQWRVACLQSCPPVGAGHFACVRFCTGGFVNCMNRCLFIAKLPR